MERLSTQLACLTVQHVIDDPGAVDALLAENPYITDCLPAALKEVFGMPSIPNAATTLKYLIVLWQLPTIWHPLQKYVLAVDHGALYLLPYINANPDIGVLGTALAHALQNEDVAIIQYLLPLFFAKNPNMDTLKTLLSYPVKHGLLNEISCILSFMSSKYSECDISDILMSKLVEVNNVRNATIMGHHGFAYDIPTLDMVRKYLTRMIEHPELRPATCSQ